MTDEKSSTPPEPCAHPREGGVLMARCTVIAAPQLGHQCGFEEGHRPPCIATPTGESLDDFSRITPAEALDFPWIEQVMLGGSMTLDGAAKYLQSTERPAPVALHISAAWHAALTERGALVELLTANPTIEKVHPCPALDDTQLGYALIFAATEPIDARRALLVYAGTGPMTAKLTADMEAPRCAHALTP